MSIPPSQSEEAVRAVRIRGNNEIRSCRYCRARLVRPAGKGRHTVVCASCGEPWHVVVLGERMIIDKLTDEQAYRAVGEARWGCLLLVLLLLAATIRACMSG